MNHMVLGGWPQDSARRTIEDDSWEVLRRMTEVTYLGQVIVLDGLVVDRILQTYMGTRWIAVRFVDVQHTERILQCRAVLRAVRPRSRVVPAIISAPPLQSRWGLECRC